jgi:hypothetical protein
MVFWELKILGEEKNCFYRRFKKYRSNYFYNKFSSYRRLVKANVKCHKLNWFASINNNLKTYFWKCVSYFRKKRKNPIEVEIDGNNLTQPCEFPECFAARLASTTTCAAFLLIFGHLIPCLQYLFFSLFIFLKIHCTESMHSISRTI